MKNNHFPAVSCCFDLGAFHPSFPTSFVYLFIYLFIYLSIYLFIIHLFIYLSFVQINKLKKITNEYLNKRFHNHLMKLSISIEKVRKRLGASK